MQNLEKETAVYCKIILLNHINWREKMRFKARNVVSYGRSFWLCWSTWREGCQLQSRKPVIFCNSNWSQIHINCTKPTMKYYRRLHPLTSFIYRLHSFSNSHLQLIIFMNCNTILNMVNSFKHSSIFELLPSLWRFKITLEFNMYPKECGMKAEMMVLLWILLQELDFGNCHYSFQENSSETISYDRFKNINMS